MICKDGSEANEAIWNELDTEVFAVVRDPRGEREDVEPELVRRFDEDRWMSLWHGVCEAWPAERIEDYELVPAAEWERPREKTSHVQVQERIATKLRQRGLEAFRAELAWWQPGYRPTDAQVNETLRATWETLRTHVFVWVRSCRIDDAERLVRFWHGDYWLMQLWAGQYEIISMEKLSEWGCLVRADQWERQKRVERQTPKLDWRVCGL